MSVYVAGNGGEVKPAGGDCYGANGRGRAVAGREEQGSKEGRVTSHKNNIGLLRLILALLVIIGHAPEMIDGNKLREPLTVIFHTISLGEFAVDGFFILSGYLITSSMFASSTLFSYMKRRILRIYPGFIIAFLLCALAVSPMVGGHPSASLKTVYHMLILETPPAYPGQLAGLPYPALNGSMWTIAYEFRCYLLVALLGVTGLLGRRRLVLALTVALAVLSIAVMFPVVAAAFEALDGRLRLQSLIGASGQTIRLTAIFLIGTCAYNYRELIVARADGRLALAGLITALAAMFEPHIAEIALAVFGGYAFFWLAFKANLGPLQQINDKWDVSYGVYLYGWPISITLLWFNRGISPVALATISVPLALAFGAVSWWGLERWAKDLGRVRRHAA